MVVKTDDQMGFKDAKTFQNTDIRKVCALIPYVDGIICCDSFLHHASAALGSPVPTIALWAGTSEKNLGYPNQTNIHSWKETEVEPNRIPHDHDYYVHKNKGSNEFKLEEIEKIIEALKSKD
jgi:ADP-heptose:LPS heptosyltransferase